MNDCEFHGDSQSADHASSPSFQTTDHEPSGDPQPPDHASSPSPSDHESSDHDSCESSDDSDGSSGYDSSDDGSQTSDDGDMPLDYFSNLLRRLPYQSTINVVLTVCERQPVTLFGTYTDLLTQPNRGIPVRDPAVPEVQMTRQSMAGALLAFLYRYHCRFMKSFTTDDTCAMVLDFFHPDRVGSGNGGDNETPEDLGASDEPFEPKVLFSNVLLHLPYRSTLQVVTTLFENEPSMLMGIWWHLAEKGVPVDVISSLPEVDRAVDCPKQCPLRNVGGEPGRTLPCRHSVFETCLRYWLGARKTCPACQKEVAWGDDDDGEKARLPPRRPEAEYVKRDLAGMTIEEMLDGIETFVKRNHGEFYKEYNTRALKSKLPDEMVVIDIGEK